MSDKPTGFGDATVNKNKHCLYNHSTCSQVVNKEPVKSPLKYTPNCPFVVVAGERSVWKSDVTKSQGILTQLY